jgi:hypothetical protein
MMHALGENLVSVGNLLELVAGVRVLCEEKVVNSRSDAVESGKRGLRTVRVELEGELLCRKGERRRQVSEVGSPRVVRTDVL